VSHILVVEDEVIVGLAMREELRDLGATVVVANDAESALEILLTTSFQAAIIDVALPGMRGDDLAQHCQRTYPAMPIVLATAMNEREVRRGLAVDSKLAILEKPYDFAALQRCLEQLGLTFSAPLRSNVSPIPA